MSLHSDINIDASLFHSSAISDSAHALNNHLMEIMANGPKWYEVLLGPYPAQCIAGPANEGHAGRRGEIQADACEWRNTSADACSP